MTPPGATCAPAGNLAETIFTPSKHKKPVHMPCSAHPHSNYKACCVTQRPPSQPMLAALLLAQAKQRSSQAG